MGKASIGSNEKIQSVLEILLDEYNLGPQNTQELVLRNMAFLDELNINRHVFLKILKKLQEEKIIGSFAIRKGSKVRYISDDKQDFDTCGISIPLSFKENSEKYISKISKEIKPVSEFVILFNDDGNLWHTDKNKFCYSIEKGSARFKFIKYLIENKGFQDTSKLADILDKKNQGVRIEKSKINTMVKKFLDLSDFIENGGNLGGYGINSKYKVLISK